MGKLRAVDDDNLVPDGKGKVLNVHKLARADADCSRECGTRTGYNHRASKGAYQSGEGNNLEAYPTSSHVASQAVVRKAYQPDNEPNCMLSVRTNVHK